jgi:hypothetical protein
MRMAPFSRAIRPRLERKTHKKGEKKAVLESFSALF